MDENNNIKNQPNDDHTPDYFKNDQVTDQNSGQNQDINQQSNIGPSAFNNQQEFSQGYYNPNGFQQQKYNQPYMNMPPPDKSYFAGDPNFDSFGAPYNKLFRVCDGLSDKSRVAAALLAFFFGGLGIHLFYLGYTKSAILRLVLCLVGSVTSCIVIGWILLVALGVWGFVDFILILTDGMHDVYGRPLRE